MFKPQQSKLLFTETRFANINFTVTLYLYNKQFLNSIEANTNGLLKDHLWPTVPSCATETAVGLNLSPFIASSTLRTRPSPLYFEIHARCLSIEDYNIDIEVNDHSFNQYYTNNTTAEKVQG